MMRPKFLSPRRGVLFAFALLTMLATISTLRPQQAAAASAVPVPKLPIVWADSNHQHAVDANNNIYYSAGTKGFFCNDPPIFTGVGTTGIAVSSNAAANQGGHTYTSTLTHFENLGTEGASTFPGCVNGSGGIYPPSYAWLTNTNSGQTFALVVPANWMGCTVNPQIEIINESKYACSNGGNGGFTYAAHAYIAEINKTTGIADGNPMVVSSMAVNTAKQTVVNGGNSSAGSSTNPTSDSNLNSTTPPCEQNNDPFTAIICPIINGLEGIGDWILTNLIQPFLVNSPIGTKATDASYQIWSEFRVYGDILLVIVLLVVVLGQSINGGLVDAYTVRKTLPRVLVAAILINLSIYIVALGVDLSNVVGAGIGNLIIEPVKASAQFQFTPNGLQIAGSAAGIGLIGLFIGSIISAGVVMPAIIWVVVIVLIPALFALIAAFVTMVVLHGLILFLAVVSPVAFGLYALPNTEKRFRQWWDWFYRALLVYPIIMTIFAIADVMTVMIQNANALNTSGGTAGSGHPLLTQTIQNVTAGLVAFLVQFLPLGMVPFAFRLAGGLVGKVHEFTHGTGKKWAEGIKGNPNDPNSLRNRTTRNLSAAVTRSQSAKLARLEEFRTPEGAPPGTPATAPGLFRRTGARVVRTFGGGNASIEFRQAQLNKQAAEQQDALSGHGDDTPIYAAAGYAVADGETYYDRNTRSEATNNSGHTRYFSSKGKELSGSQYSAGKTRGGRTLAGLGQAYRYTLQKAQDDTDIEANRFAFKRNAEKGGWSQSDVNNIFPAADYPNKGPFLDEWYSKPKMGSDGKLKWEDVTNNQDNYRDMTKELNRTRQPHLLAGGRDRGFRVMEGWQKTLQDRVRANAYTDTVDPTSGAVTATAAKNRETDLNDLARTYQIFDNASTELYSGAVIASGATSEAKGVIEAAVRNRRSEGFALGERQADGSRAISYQDAAGNAVTSRATPGDEGIRPGG